MAQASLPPYLEVLNPEQREAVLHTGKPLLILAGAGSGKTRVITTKIAYLIREQGVNPRSILAVTFTNKAAREMANRARLIEESAETAMLRTFHSFGAWFLRRNSGLANLPTGFVIYDDDDMVSLLSTIMENPRAEVKAMARNISRAKDHFLSPDDPGLDLIDHRKIFRRIYREYEEKLGRIGNVDFGDLIKKPVEILRQYTSEAQRIRSYFRVILVDEYQDANVAQFELLKELCDSDTYVCVVGDDDQSIYGFRGAEVKNILEFPDRFPGTDIIRLERNYRSTAPILQAASSVVDHNRNRLGKMLRSERGPGKKPVLAFLPDQDEEAKFCAELIANSVNKQSDSNQKHFPGTSKKSDRAGKTHYADWAILYRTNAQSLEFETEFLHRHIPYRVVGSLKFYEREEIKDALALLAFLVNPRDEVAFRRVVNKPSRGIGPAAIERTIEEASGTVISDKRTDNEIFFDSNATGGTGNLEAALRRIAPELSAKARAGAAEFLKAIEAGRETLDRGPIVATNETPEERSKTTKKQAAKRDGLRSGEGLSPCVVSVVEASGLAKYHLSHDEIAGNQRLYNLQELANAASIYPATLDGLLEFLEHIELDRAMEENPSGTEDVVTLITLHNTKGLEFPRVIITGVEQGVFPREDKTGDDLEEERRLFYVGATRAMNELYLCSCSMRRMYGSTMPMQPSVFLREIDKDALKVIGLVPSGFETPEMAVMRRKVQTSRTANGKKSSADSSSDEYWQKGDRVFHDDYGYGEVREVRDSEDGPVVRVFFENGGEIRFLSEHQGRNFTRIREEW
jgi:DNA helicase-2/ATP-dependent DNA helicase PcrA